MISFKEGRTPANRAGKTGPQQGGTLPGPFAPSIYAKHGKEEGDVKINKDPASPSAGLAKMELQTPRVGLRVPPPRSGNSPARGARGPPSREASANLSPLVPAAGRRPAAPFRPQHHRPRGLTLHSYFGDTCLCLWNDLPRPRDHLAMCRV